MSKTLDKRKRGSSLVPLSIAAVAVAVLLAYALATVVTTVVGRRLTAQDARATVTGSLSGYTAFQQHRYRQLQLISRIFATDPVLSGYLASAAADGDAVKVLDLVEAYQNLLTFDLAIVFDLDGRVVARTDRPGESGEDLSSTAMIREALNSDRAFGVWRQGDALYHAVTVPLVRDFDAVGHVLVALAIDDALATQLQRINGAEVVFLALDQDPNGRNEPLRVAATLDPSRSAALIAGLAAERDTLARVGGRGDTIDGVEIETSLGPRSVAMTPLRDAAEQPVGLIIAAVDPTATSSGFLFIRLGQLAGAVLGLVAGGSLMGWLGRRHQLPWRRLAVAAEKISRGELEASVPADLGGEARPVGDALALLTAELRGRAGIDAVLVEAARRLPEPGQEPVERSTSATEVLLACELRRYANPRSGYDPEETVARFGRDLRRVAHAVETRHGRIVAVTGHRILSRFSNQQGALAALAAAAEAVRALGERENVFDEPEPPAIAIVGGTTVAGTVAWGGGSQPALLGVPVQQLESLLREATPGEIYLAKGIYEALAPQLATAGVELEPQRGMLTSQPLYVIAGEVAARALSLPATSLASLDEDRRQLTDVIVGTVLGGRFEVLGRLGTGTHGEVWKARDRERDRFVALRLLRSEIGGDAEQLERLTSRIRIVRTIDHPHLVGVWDVGAVDGLPYVMMDYVRAISLDELQKALGRIPVRAAVRIGRQIAAGVAAGHALKLPHLGLSPENVLIDAAGSVRVADYGLADAGERLPATAPAAAYRAPEQLEALSSVDLAADVWAIGALLYAMLAGQPPHGTGAASNRSAAGQREPDPVGTRLEVSDSVAAVVMRCLAREPADRYPSAEALRSALAALRL